MFSQAIAASMNDLDEDEVPIHHRLLFSILIFSPHILSLFLLIVLLVLFLLPPRFSVLLLAAAGLACVVSFIDMRVFFFCVVILSVASWLAKSKVFLEEYDTLVVL